MHSSILIALFATAFVSARPALNGGDAPLDFQFPPLPPPRPPVFPAGFEELLPAEAKDKLIAAHNDKSLSYDERRDRIEAVMDELPVEVLEKLPLPPGLQRLPENFRAPFRALHVDRTMDWRERQQRVDDMVKQLPEEMQRVVAPPAPMQFGQGLRPVAPGALPAHPPAGFESALSPTIYKQLLAVHENQQMSDKEKKQLLNAVMRMVPRDQLERLPMPPGFERLPAESLQRVKMILHNFDLDWDTRHEKINDFVRQLPREEQRLIRPAPPHGFESLPVEVHDQIGDLFLNNKLSPMERDRKIHEIIMSLPVELRAKLPPPPPAAPRALNDAQEPKDEAPSAKETPTFV